MSAPIKLVPGYLLLTAFVLACTTLDAQVTLNSNCTVGILNRTARVREDGTWVLPNIPVTGPARVRASCTVNGKTVSGQSELINIQSNTDIDSLPISFDNQVKIPEALFIGSDKTKVGTKGETVQLTVTATYVDGTSMDVTHATPGITYSVSNQAIAT